MKIRPFAVVASIGMLAVPAIILAADKASDADKAFVEKVSQGGMYEVEASKLAEDHATAADVKDQAVTEVHDHTVVNNHLKKIAEAAGLTVATELNASFSDSSGEAKRHQSR